MKNIMKAFSNFMNGNLKVIEVTKPGRQPYYLIRKGIFVHRYVDREDYKAIGKIIFRYCPDVIATMNTHDHLRFKSADDVYEVLTSRKNVSIKVKPAHQWIEES